jgi:1-acyl-sn-glycerol-3-phosphate acyltransferase
MSRLRGPAIDFAPERWRDRLRFRLVGRPLFAASMRRLATAGTQLGPESRARLQRAVADGLLTHLRVQIDFHGLGDLPRNPHVIVALHEGIADPLCLSRLPCALRFVARDEVFEWPWIGPALRRMRHIAIDPERPAVGRAFIQAVDEALRAGEHVVFFPQGTVLGIETAFQPGAFRVARLLQAPILPIVLTGSHRIWEHPFSARLRYGQRAAVAVLPAIPAHEVCNIAPAQLSLNLQRNMKSAALSGRFPQPRRFVPDRDGFWDGFAYDIDPEFPTLRAQVERHRAALVERNCDPRD